MSKSILVIDTPENCMRCDLENRHHCVWGMRYIEDFEFEFIPDWCPVKSVPRKKEENKYHNNYEKGYDAGFNACIDKILKGDGTE